MKGTFTSAELKLLRSADDVVDGTAPKPKPPREPATERQEAEAMRRLRASRPQTDRALLFLRLAPDTDPALLPALLVPLDRMLAYRLELGHTLAVESIRARMAEVRAILARRRP